MSTLSVIWYAATIAGVAGVREILTIGLVFLVVITGCLARDQHPFGQVA